MKRFRYIENGTAKLSMAVEKEYRNQGIGTKLMKVIVAEYQKIGVKQYKRLGWEIIEETKTSWIMKKKI